MPRRPRTHLDGVPLHLVQRGHNREPCFFGEIELNPVRAAMVDDPAHYRWTSYRHNALGQSNPYLTPHALYLALDRDDETRRAAYLDLFRAQLDAKAIEDIRLALNQNQPLGNSRFHQRSRP